MAYAAFKRMLEAPMTELGRYYYDTLKSKINMKVAKIKQIHKEQLQKNVLCFTRR